MESASRTEPPWGDSMSSSLNSDSYSESLQVDTHLTFSSAFW